MLARVEYAHRGRAEVHARVVVAEQESRVEGVFIGGGADDGLLGRSAPPGRVDAFPGQQGFRKDVHQARAPDQRRVRVVDDERVLGVRVAADRAY